MKNNKTNKLVAILTSLIILLLPITALAEDFPKLDEAIPGTFVSELAPVFDFDGYSCLPSAGISRDGEKNEGESVAGGGLDDLTKNCRSSDFLNTSNTLHRHSCISDNGSEYCGHFYALYFEKDDCVTTVCGHGHDWEYAAVWTKDGEITHGSHSEHGSLITWSKSDLAGRFENGHLKIVYHLTNTTHAMRFAFVGESAENPYGSFVTPTIISWENLTGDGICNEAMRKKLNIFNYGSASIPLKDYNFFVNLNKYKPEGYPFFNQFNEPSLITDLFSEEAGSKICPDDYIVTGVVCSGSHCDNKQLKCRSIPGLTLGEDLIYSPSFSEEGINYYKSEDIAVVGMQCMGSLCDIVTLIMRYVDNETEGEWSDYFSEENGLGDCGNGYVAGVECTGDSCDNLRLYCKENPSDNDTDLVCEYTDWFSEEYGGRQECPPNGSIVTGVECSGSHCDDKRLKCCSMPGLTLGEDLIHSTSFSEEGINYYKSEDKAVVGMQCTGPLCDIITLIMRYVDNETEGEWSDYFSDENVLGDCNSGYVSGVECTGASCDNLRLYCKENPFDNDNDLIPDDFDNCLSTHNAQQLDADGDGDGDLCDEKPGCGGGCGQPTCEVSCDMDSDGILYTDDNCPYMCNSEQIDADGDGIGDVCDSEPGCEGCGISQCETEC